MLSTLFANDVRQTLDQFRRSVDQAFETFYGPGHNYSHGYPAPSAGNAEREWTFSPILESGWTEHSLGVRAILPGVTENDVRVSVQGNQLTIEGERKAPEGFEKNPATPLAYGKFRTVVTLPAGLDVDRTRCQLRHGILDIQIPMLEASKPKHIPIQTGDGQKAISS